MSYSIERVAVLGAGTMGAGIAAQVANAGVPVLLLDIAPRELEPAEEARGLSLDDRRVRNRIVQAGFDRIRKIKPASFMGAAAVQRIELGNFEDDFDRLAEVDWVIEAVVERLDIKQQLMARLEETVGDDTIVTTNTSGLPIARIAEGRNDGFRSRFFGTHFFNPPRYMNLLEVIETEDTEAEAVLALSDFATDRLGKGIVPAKDRPNFIGNRILSVHGSYVIAQALAGGYRFEEVDALTGPLIGRPKTGTFRLQDLVGIDIASGVARNLYDLIPEDPYRDAIADERATEVMGGLIERGWLGNKTKQGFYRKGRDGQGKTVFEVLDPETWTYGAQQDVAFPSLAELSKVRSLGDRLRGFFDPRWDDDRGAQLVRRIVTHFLAYSAARAHEIAFDLQSIDDAIRWGFSYELGPFELWDLLGVEETVGHIEAQGFEVAPWVRTLLASGATSFYGLEDGRRTGVWDWDSESYEDLELPAEHITIAELRHERDPVRSNRSASLHDLGDDILLLEFHSKANAIDDGVVEMMHAALELLDDERWIGLVIGNDGANFCVGANLGGVGQLALQGDWDGVDGATRALQHALRDLRDHPKPVVAAVHGMALGGGAEIVMGVNRVVAAGESYIGLVEAGVGLIPGGGGLKELVRRRITDAADRPHGDPLPAAQACLETVAMAKVSGSAEEARELGFLGTRDRVVMNRAQLLFEAGNEVLAMIDEGYERPDIDALYAGGADLRAPLEVAVWSLEQAGFASAHDAEIARTVAHVLAGGDASAPSRRPEEHFLRLEREGFVKLLRTEKTQARMRHMLETGKPLRN
ncbi:MAG: 3-hydroxyacyl-CoA dehydrogenase/enoyl-CoA hydratase family protein [Acidobacteriota bacterium]